MIKTMHAQSKLKNQNQKPKVGKQKLIKIIVSGVIATLLLTLFPIIPQVQADYAEHLIDEEFDGAAVVCIADLNGDTYMDIIGGTAGAGVTLKEIAWWKNEDGFGSFGSKQVIDSNFSGVSSINAADFDKDGDKDILATAWVGDETAWWENNGDGTSWTKHLLKSWDAREAHYADFDGDGDTDIVGLAFTAVGYTIIWWENPYPNTTTDTWTEHGIGSPSQVRLVYSADLDNDGDIDILVNGLGTHIRWYENSNQGLSWTPHDIGTDLGSVSSIYAEDLNNDGKNEVIAADSGYHKIVWWENLGSGSFGSKQTINTEGDFDGAISVYSGDMDGDGDMDVSGAGVGKLSDWIGKIAWWENKNGLGTSWEKHLVKENFDYACSVCAGDVDNDGYMDIIGAAQKDDDIAWWEIEKEDMGAGGERVHGVAVGDGDNDGNKEVYASNYDGNIYRFSWGALGWVKEVIDSVIGGPGLRTVAIGNGDNQNNDNEVYVASISGGIYQLKWNSGTQTWDKTQFGSEHAMNDMAIGDGDSNGSEEVYAASQDGHIYKFTWNDPNWVEEDVGEGIEGQNPAMHAVAIGNGDNVVGNEVYATYSTFEVGNERVYQFSWNDPNWVREEVDTETSMIDLVVGDGDNDNQDELYAAGGSIYQYSWSGSNWVREEVGFGEVEGAFTMYGVAIGDGDNDTKNEVYGACVDSFMYQFKWDSGDTTWYRENLGYGKVQNYMLSVAVGDGNNDGNNEIYGGVQDGHVYQFRLLTKNKAKGLPPGLGLDVVLVEKDWIDVEEIGQTGLKNVFIKKDGTIISEFRVDFSQVLDWSDIKAEVSGNKALIHIPFADHPEIIGSAALYIPNPGGATEALVCQGATSTDMVGPDCYDNYGPGNGPVTAEYTIKLGEDPVLVDGTIAGNPRLARDGGNLKLVDIKGTGAEPLGGEEEAVPEFTTLTLIIAAVAGFGIYLLIRRKNSQKKPKEA